jgi:type I restriction enzyme, S subunit
MQLLEHFNELSLHPKNAKELKGLILQLAIQGNLTSRWRDENCQIQTGLELLNETKKLKDILIKEKKINKENSLPSINPEELPFELPEKWSYCRLRDVGYTMTGGTPSKSNSTFFGNDIPFLKPGDIKNWQVDYENEGLSNLGKDNLNRIAPAGSILMVCLGTIGKCAIIDKDCSFNQQINSITSLKVDSEYLLFTLSSDYFYKTAWSKSTSTTIALLNKGKWESIIIPIPPLEEQKAIVEVVNQLFAEVDQLENLTKERIHLKEDFVTSALKQLSTGDTSTEWAFLKEHFSTFFTEKANIKKLRESILQLAVQGKLTSDWRKLNPDIENAKVLLERIKKEKEQLVKEKKIKKENPLPKISDEEIPYELPEGWVWCRLGEIVSLINGDRGKNYPNVNEYVTEGIPWINTGHILPNGTLSERKMNFITEEKFKSLNSGKIQSGDLVYCLRGATFGKTAFVYPFEAGAIASSLVIIRPINIALGNFLYNYLISKTARQQLLRFDNGSAQPNLSANNVKLYLTPLPAHQEQQIIVEKVNSLMALCDELEAAIETSKNTQEKWMESSLREVFEGDKTEY